MAAREKYQIYLSSTSRDLRSQRQAILERLHNQDFIPMGMEYFNSSGTPQPDYIARAVEDSDIVVLVIAGKYGTSDDRIGMSYTEYEYRLAKKKNIPVIPFICHIEGIPNEWTDHLYNDADGTENTDRSRLDRLRKELGSETNLKYWDYDKAADLASMVSDAVNECIRSRQETLGRWVHVTGPAASNAEPKATPGRVGHADETVDTPYEQPTEDDLRSLSYETIRTKYVGLAQKADIYTDVYGHPHSSADVTCDVPLGDMFLIYAEQIPKQTAQWKARDNFLKEVTYLPEYGDADFYNDFDHIENTFVARSLIRRIERTETPNDRNEVALTEKGRSFLDYLEKHRTTDQTTVAINL